MFNARFRIAFVPWGILLLLLVLQALLVAKMPGRSLGGDEPYYVSKARHVVEHGRLPKALSRHRAVEAGAWGDSDWRPPGYALMVALASGGSFEAATLRRKITVLQFSAIAAAALLAFSLLRGQSSRLRVAAAVLIGIAPWPFAFVTTIGADSLNAAVALFGLFLLCRGRLFFGSLVLSSTLLLRPEMIAVVPIPIAVALLTSRRSPRDWIAAAAGLLIVVSLQYGYRAYFIGKPTLSLFGGLHVYNQGAFAWANSWLGTEDEAYDFVYGLTEGDTTGPLPSRAFADERERRMVEEIRASVRAEGRYGPEADRRFAELARERVREHPIRAWLLPRVWHSIHVWINLETNDPLLHALRAIDRPIRRAILGMLLVLKVALVTAFAIRVVRAGRGILSDPTLAIMASFVIARTLLVGFVLNWMVYRYLIAAWLPLLVVVFLPLRRDADTCVNGARTAAGSITSSDSDRSAA